MRRSRKKYGTNLLSEKDMALIKKFPEIKLPNKFYMNKGDAKFDDAENA